jgi:hypothetical protein
MKRRLKGRYKGPLDATSNSAAIDFFHRTVHDFVRLKAIQEFLNSHLPDDFNARITLCQIYLAPLKDLYKATGPKLTDAMDPATEVKVA